jgi:hypothetical protein
MNILPGLMLTAIGLALAAPDVAAQELSSYRNAHLGMEVTAIAALTGSTAADATVIYRRPTPIRELVSRSGRVGAGTAANDPVQDIVFTFYDDALFRIVATYDRGRIAGLTDADLINGLSAQYGTATIPAAAVTTSRLSQAGRDSAERIIARWEDAEFSVNLIRYSYASTVSLVMFSKPLDALAREAIVEAARLDLLEAPAREAARQERSEIEARAAEDKARLANKPAFRP